MSLYDMVVTDIRGGQQKLEAYRGQVLLIVNTASRCGLTPHFEGLQQLYENYHDQGFAVLGFPSNQFKQELGDNSEIAQSCSLNYGVTFPMFARIAVNGPDAHPLFELLKDEARGVFGSKAIKWNFTKFLVDRNGRVVKRFAPNVQPSRIESSIKTLL